MSFASNPDKSDLIFENSTKFPAAEEYSLGNYDRQQTDFYNYLKNLPNKINALTRIAPYLNHNQIKLIYNSFLKGQLS